jgi:hypothetical protein
MNQATADAPIATAKRAADSTGLPKPAARDAGFVDGRYQSLEVHVFFPH